ncbi:thiolase domain-containing protein [Desulfoscipio gibsoniae]|uniref:propanoyl-CoA C-acyltransferase n=1 Tax=Desulfoscipio gibsoniae DSM 7213 TaxID=767817 RepID=R4KLH7_9FIRM|nr:thiolase domain-containing protein [Desulfoscipio gibsoniae]AGL01410.1 acetyl-CoA acetyltransferase [Desulfoscipio gibsoniae DSM 7213]
MSKDVAIIGVGQSAFVRGYQGSIRELAFEAFREAMQDAGISKSDIDASIICSAPEYDSQRSPSGIIAEYLGLNPQPTFAVETVCSSSTTGLRAGYAMVKSGLHDIIVVLGFQKMSEISSADSQERMGRGGDIMWESPFGSMMPAYYAMHACAHFDKYGSTEKDLAMIRVKAAKYGTINEKAVYRKEVSLEDALNAPYVSSPLKRFDCCANADGASCIIIANKDRAKDICPKPVWFMGLGSATASMTLTNRDTLYGIACARKAAQEAYAMAGVTPQDIDVAEVHDCFTIAELLAYEALGFAEPGKGVELIREGQTYIGGKIPVNVDGGLLSKGHPIGATGGSQVRTIVLQLRDEAGGMQVPGAEIGLIHNIGGVGVYGNVIILGR